MKKIIWIQFLLLLMACNSISKTSKNPPQNQQEVQKKKTQVAAEPIKKGKFLDYIYQILPSHKQPGYSIRTAKLNYGYAFGEGPYDGSFFEFYLFRADKSDLVLMQMSGYEVEAKDKGYKVEKVFGVIVDSYFFQQSKMHETKFTNLIPVREIEKLYQKSYDRLSTNGEIKLYKTGVNYWHFYQYLKLPQVGTSIQLYSCKDEPELPFVVKTRCAVIGALLWDKQKSIFKLKAAQTLEIVDAEL